MMSWKLKLPFTSQFILKRYVHPREIPQRDKKFVKKPPRCPNESAPYTWRTISGFTLAAVGLLSFNVYMSLKDHKFVGPEFMPWEYLRIRTKVNICLNTETLFEV
ncbi:hypothetical protein C0J52_15242 [Blattella germanica]|nr:hypothetical protein C0J52_15242 [Blattella germanica]